MFHVKHWMASHQFPGQTNAKAEVLSQRLITLCLVPRESERLAMTSAKDERLYVKPITSWSVMTEEEKQAFVSAFVEALAGKSKGSEQR
jgi:catalase